MRKIITAFDAAAIHGIVSSAIFGRKFVVPS
jgi:hypothetical protein